MTTSHAKLNVNCKTLAECLQLAFIALCIFAVCVVYRAIDMGSAAQLSDEVKVVGEQYTIGPIDTQDPVVMNCHYSEESLLKLAASGSQLARCKQSN